MYCYFIYGKQFGIIFFFQFFSLQRLDNIIAIYHSEIGAINNDNCITLEDLLTKKSSYDGK